MYTFMLNSCVFETFLPPIIGKFHKIYDIGVIYFAVFGSPRTIWWLLLCFDGLLQNAPF